MASSLNVSLKKVSCGRFTWSSVMLNDDDKDGRPHCRQCTTQRVTRLRSNSPELWCDANAGGEMAALATMPSTARLGAGAQLDLNGDGFAEVLIAKDATYASERTPRASSDGK
ncbi:MAG: hypothetical protein JKY37_29970 [Nannocystaceae bacterium]|nr:hypothetical protein [Nannocystaceae bacterium]